MEILGYVLAALVGISLGLIGGGGSILTVPILVYVMRVNPVLATSYSLFIVGSTSMVGAYNNYRKGFVSIKTALLFGLSSTHCSFYYKKDNNAPNTSGAYQRTSFPGYPVYGDYDFVCHLNAAGIRCYDKRKKRNRSNN